MNSPQNQHYVPKFILRQFLTNEDKEQVSVFDKHEERMFTTSIANVMAERRFNDFVIDDDLLSIEAGFSRVESELVPIYRGVLETRRLEPSDEEQKAALSFLVALQFVRTRAHRERWAELERAIQEKVEAMGHEMKELEGWTPPTEDRLKLDHIIGIRESLPEFAALIHAKEFILCEAAPGRSFYLGDNPVSLHNQRKFGPYGNLGLALPGIEIYMPLSANLMLGAWCPSIMDAIRTEQREGKFRRREEIVAAAYQRRFPVGGIKHALDLFAPLEGKIDAFITNVDEGRPIASDDGNMDFFNSLETMFAYRYVVCQQGDFELARRHNAEFPRYRKGLRPTMD